jgi:hypothetical protein
MTVGNSCENTYGNCFHTQTLWILIARVVQNHLHSKSTTLSWWIEHQKNRGQPATGTQNPKLLWGRSKWATFVELSRAVEIARVHHGFAPTGKPHHRTHQTHTNHTKHTHETQYETRTLYTQTKKQTKHSFPHSFPHSSTLYSLTWGCGASRT